MQRPLGEMCLTQGAEGRLVLCDLFTPHQQNQHTKVGNNKVIQQITDFYYQCWRHPNTQHENIDTWIMSCLFGSQPGMSTQHGRRRSNHTLVLTSSHFGTFWHNANKHTQVIFQPGNWLSLGFAFFFIFICLVLMLWKNAFHSMATTVGFFPYLTFA